MASLSPCFIHSRFRYVPEKQLMYFPSNKTIPKAAVPAAFHSADLDAAILPQNFLQENVAIRGRSGIVN